MNGWPVVVFQGRSSNTDFFDTQNPALLHSRSSRELKLLLTVEFLCWTLQSLLTLQGAPLILTWWSELRHQSRPSQRPQRK